MSKILILFFLFCLVSCAHYEGKYQYKLKSNIPYSDDIKNERLMGDLYLSSNKNAPLVIVVHGGGWRSRSKSDMDSTSISLAQNGFNVFNINYQFSPKFRHPTQIDNLELALNFLKTKYKNKLSFNKVGLWGYSSGAHTVLMYALTRDKSIDAIVSGGSPYDFNWYKNSPYIKDYMGFYRKNHIDDYAQASPITHLNSSSPPMFLFHGKEDNLLEHSQMTAFEAKAIKLGIKVKSLTVDFWGHAMTFAWSAKPLESGIKFLKGELL